jgi:hypothetical protein
MAGAGYVDTYGAASNPTFDLVLSDSKSGTPLWRSHILTNSDLALVHTHRASKGRDLADLLIARLKSDGVLSCDNR